MYRATTPTHRFRFPRDLSEFRTILITYKQKGKIVMEKSKAELTIDGNVAKYVLSQDEANAFAAGDRSVSVQIRAVDNNGTALASRIFQMNVNDVLNDEVLT
jgi:hypothetical protein